MKKTVFNNVICVGSFNGPDIEEGTFHEGDGNVIDDMSHKHKCTQQKCPCGSVESNQADEPESSNSSSEGNIDNKD